jgi:hypothetical protein
MAAPRPIAFLHLLVIVLASSAASCPPQPVGDAILAGATKAIEQIPTQSQPQILPLRTDPPEVTFGMVSAGSKTERLVAIINASDAAVTIAGFSNSGEYFRVYAPDLPVRIAARARTEVRIQFEPVEACRCRGTLTLTTSEPKGKQVISMSGHAQRRQSE